MVNFRVHKPDGSHQDNPSAACFAVFNSEGGRKNIKGITYYPQINKNNPGYSLISKEDVYEYVGYMREIGFELSLECSGDCHSNINDGFYIHTEKREIFKNKAPLNWIIGNLIAMRYVEEFQSTVKDFLTLCRENPTEDKWYLFWVANQVAGNCSSHALFYRGMRFKPFSEVIQNLQKDREWNSGGGGFAINAHFANGLDRALHAKAAALPKTRQERTALITSLRGACCDESD